MFRYSSVLLELSISCNNCKVYIGMILNAEYVFLSKLINAYFDSAKHDGTTANV